MIKEIKFVVTNEIRRPKENEWFLNDKGFPIRAAQSFTTSKYPILKMEITDDHGPTVSAS
jgi:hypothetical protein